MEDKQYQDKTLNSKMEHSVTQPQHDRLKQEVICPLE